MNAEEPTKLVIASHFPGPPEVGTAGEGHDGWTLSRLWSGYPELEWTFGVFGERVKAFGGQIPAYFYEDVSDFDTARWLVRMSSALVSRHEPSYPSVGLLAAQGQNPDGNITRRIEYSHLSKTPVMAESLGAKRG